MAKSFTITTSTSGLLKADAKGHAQTAFIVTNIATRPVIGKARTTSLGDTKPGWLLIMGETDRNFGINSTQPFTVSFDAGPGTPPGKYQFRLDVLNAEGDLAEGPVVIVELATATPPEQEKKKKLPWWIILVIVGVLVLVVVVVLIIVLR